MLFASLLLVKFNVTKLNISTTVANDLNCHCCSHTECSVEMCLNLYEAAL